MITIKSFGNANQGQIIKLQRALIYCNGANISDTFKDKVMTAKFTETTDTNAQIYENTQKDVEISVSFYTPPWWRRLATNIAGIFTLQGFGLTVSASEGGDGSITFNSIAFASETIPTLSGLIRHESLHSPKAGGYKHSYLPNANRPSSVNYLCETFVRQIVGAMGV